MRRFNCIAAWAVVALLGATSTRVWANITIAVDESGKGNLTNPATGNFPLPSTLSPDPGPGGLPLALTYNLLGPPGLVAGDLIVLDPTNTVVSEIIRFNPAGTGGNTAYPASLVFYSDILDLPNALADTGVPTVLYTNTRAITEVGGEGSNGVTYTPNANDPGFVSGAGSTVTYQITSDVLPEPAALSVLLLMPAAALCRPRRQVRVEIQEGI